MRGRILLLFPTVLVFGCAGTKDANAKSDAAPAAQTKADHSADEATLRSMYQAMPQQVTGSNMGAMFADDGVEIQPGMAPVKGPDAIQKAMTGLLASMKDFKLSVGTVNVTVADAGDLAVVEAPYQLSYTDPKGKAVNDHGTSMTIYKKINGQWKILYDTNVSEVAQ